MTVQPSSSSARTIASPTRLPPPVTIAVRSAHSCSSLRAEREAIQNSNWIASSARIRRQCERDARTPSAPRSLWPEPRRACRGNRGAWRSRRRSTAGTRRIAAIRACASPATAPGITRARRSTGRRWSGCSRRCCAANPTAATCWSRPVEKLTIDVEATAFRATQMTMAGEGEQRRRIGLTLDSGDALIVGPDHPLSVVDTPDRPLPAHRGTLRAGGRARPAALLRTGRNRACRGPRTRPESGPTALSSRLVP